MIDNDPRIERYRNVTDLRKYDREFRVVNDGTNGDEPLERIWEMSIQGKYGQIYPSGFNGDLSVSIISSNIYNKVCTILSRKPGPTGTGDEYVLRFPHKPELLRLVAAAVRARRSRKGRGPKLTPEQVAANVARLKAWRAAHQKPVAPLDSKVA